MASSYSRRIDQFNQVHVWRSFLDLTEPQMARIFTILSADEIERARRFHFERDKKRFMAARGFFATDPWWLFEQDTTRTPF